MADHSKPTITSTYSDFVAEMDARYNDLAVGLDPAVTTATNVPNNAIRWNSVNNKWEKYDGSSWSDLTTKLTTQNWIIEESPSGDLQIKTSGGILKFSMSETIGFTAH
jgi:hypothetical protein